MIQGINGQDLDTGRLAPEPPLWASWLSLQLLFSGPQVPLLGTFPEPQTDIPDPCFPRIWFSISHTELIIWLWRLPLSQHLPVYVKHFAYIISNPHKTHARYNYPQVTNVRIWIQKRWIVRPQLDLTPDPLNSKSCVLLTICNCSILAFFWLQLTSGDPKQFISSIKQRNQQIALP